MAKKLKDKSKDCKHVWRGMNSFGRDKCLLCGKDWIIGLRNIK